MNEINFNVEDIEEINLSMDVGIKKIYPPIENLEVTPTKEQQVFTHENSYGYDEVVVNAIPDEYIIPEGVLPITENKTYDVTKYERVSASVYPALNLQDKEVTPTREIQTITSDENYDGLNEVKVNAIPDSYTETSGTLTITENGTYDVKQYAEVTTNIEGGSGSVSISTVTEMKDSVTNSINTLLRNLDGLVDAYPRYTNENVTLYTPASGYNYYVIRKRAENAYGIVWFNAPYYILYENSTTFMTVRISIKISTIYLAFDDVVETNVELSNATSSCYLSTSTYSTIDECLSAIQNPNTTYSSGSYFRYTSMEEDGYMVPLTNLPCLYSENQNGLSRKISSNETIQVIS